jgi:hypothetical protein
MYKLALTLCIAALAFAGPAATQTYPLDSAKGFELHNAVAEPVTFQGKKAIRVTSSAEAAAGPGDAARQDHLVIAPVQDFSNGTIEVDLAGEPGPGAAGGARGFVGVAFRLQNDKKTYDTFYLRPTNGRADDQERRNHTAQYISHPDWPWFRLRQETPSKYESYVDIEPAKWIHVKIDVNGDKARLYVNGNDQPTLIVNDVKSGANAKGAVALWFEGSTVAHYANLKIAKK